MTASATGLLVAPKAARDNDNATAMISSRIFRESSPLGQTRQPSRAVANTVLVNVEQVHHAQQKVPRRYGLRRISQMTPSLEFPRGSPGENVTHIEMPMLIR